MKLLKMCVFLLLLIFAWSCNNTRKKISSVKKDNAEVIIVSMDKLVTRDGLYLRYDDNMDNEMHYPYDKTAATQPMQRISSQDPVIFNDDDVLGQGARYVLVPGDSVRITENPGDKMLKFTSNNDIRNNELGFFNALKNNLEKFNYYKMAQAIKFGGAKNQVLKEIFIYYKSADYKFAVNYTTAKYNDQLAFLKSYESGHPLSPKMQQVFEDILYFDYTTFKFMIALNMAKRNLKPDNEFAAEVQTFQQKISKENYSYISGYRSSLRDYVTYLNITANPQKLPVYSLISQNFSSYAKDYLLFYTVRKYISAQKINEQMLNDFYGDCQNSAYTSEIKRISDLSSHETQRGTLTDNMGKKTTLDAIRDRYKAQKDSVLYIDFWASWCVPCMQQMPYAAKLREDLKDYPIRFLYLSMDNSFSSWQSSSKLLKHNSADNFLVANNFHSPLASTFNLTTIPRYIIINKAGEIIAQKDNNGAPSEKGTSELLIRLANEKIAANSPVKINRPQGK
ncbi:MAG: TlpA disulfide reductase family protein [Bacteroidota bacterium]